jgi:hypothetical protein
MRLHRNSFWGDIGRVGSLNRCLGPVIVGAISPIDEHGPPAAILAQNQSSFGGNGE